MLQPFERKERLKEVKLACVAHKGMKKRALIKEKDKQVKQEGSRRIIVKVTG